MKGPEPKTSAELSDLEAPTSVGEENAAVKVGEPTAQQDFRERVGHEQTVAHLRLVWESRRFLGRVTGSAVLLSALFALLIPNRYQSAARLMPPDDQSGSSLAMAAAAPSGGAAGGLSGIVNEFLGLRSASDLLVGVLSSRTVEDKLIQRFDLRKVYGARRMEDAREDLAARTDVSVDRKSQIITLIVTDKSPQRAAAMAQAYVEELNRTVAEMSTSSARRERISLEGRLQAVNEDLEAAEKDFSLFASANPAIDIKDQGKDMVEAAATLQGQISAARSDLEGLRRLYADSNVRVGAKVQEPKEIPTVKVLDAPNLPEKKSFPPRTLIVLLLGAALAFSCGAIWVFGRRMWEQTDPADPGKVLAQEILDTVRNAMPLRMWRFHNLVDKKLDGTASQEESNELQRIERALSAKDVRKKAEMQVHFEAQHEVSMQKLEELIAELKKYPENPGNQPSTR